FVTITVGLAWPWVATAQQAFPTPEQAAHAVVAALGTERADQARLTELLGEEWRSFIPRQGVQRKDVDAFLQQYREEHRIEKTSEYQALLSVGSEHWTLPIPMIKTENGWRF